ncbi:hypothetical protein MRX96_020090 [Rhipicephalus microplus]
MPSITSRNQLARESGLLSLLFCLLLSGTVHRCDAQQSQTQQVTTNFGIVTGTLVQAPAPGLVTQVPVYAFQGIRYAKPPVGWRRFERPEPLDQRSSFSDNLRASPRCLQWTTFPSERIVGEEDCLFLDIYVPATYFAAPATKLPVVVFIPGADFKSGGKDEIKTRIRLWIEKHLRGCQLQARRSWFSEHGRRERQGQHGTLGSTDGASFRQVKHRGLRRDPGENHSHGLRSRSDVRVVPHTQCCIFRTFFSSHNRKAHYNKIRFLPIVDANITTNAFLTNYPRLMFCQGRFTPKPTIYGYTKNAGSLRYFERINQLENPKSVDSIVQTYLNEFFEDEDSRVGVTAAVRFQYYRPRSSLSNATRNAVNTINMLTDFLVGAPVEMALSGHLRLLQSTSYTTPNPAFFYIFGIPNAPRTFADLQKGSRELYGATYMDDMLYSVNTGGLVQTTDPVRDPLIVGYMTTFFTAFINGL